MNHETFVYNIPHTCVYMNFEVKDTTVETKCILHSAFH